MLLEITIELSFSHCHFDSMAIESGARSVLHGIHETTQQKRKVIGDDEGGLHAV